MDPVGALIGSILIGLGLSMVYGAYKNRALFGENGIITTAIRTGRLPDAKSMPPLFPGLAKLTPVDKGPAGETGQWRMPTAVTQSIDKIAEADPGLAARLADELGKLDSDSSKEEARSLLMLLTVTEASGYANEAGIIRDYVESLVVSLR